MATEDGGLALRPWGLLWVGTNSRFAKALTDAIEADSGSGPVTVSLERSTAIDAATAASIVSGQETAELAGREFAVRNPPRGAEVVLSGFGVPVIANSHPSNEAS